MLEFHAREGRKEHAYTDQGDPGALLGLLRRAKDGSAALPLSKMPPYGRTEWGAGQRMGKPMLNRPEMEKLPASPHVLGKCGALGESAAPVDASRDSRGHKRRYPQIPQALNARESYIKHQHKKSD